MKKYKKLIILFSVSVFLASCGGGSDTKPVVTEVKGTASNGKIYYQYECSGCHSAGDDFTRALGASDLAQKQKLIKSNLTQYGDTLLPNIGGLMGQFKNLSEQRVADLKAYLASL